MMLETHVIKSNVKSCWTSIRLDFEHERVCFYFILFFHFLVPCVRLIWLPSDLERTFSLKYHLYHVVTTWLFICARSDPCRAYILLVAVKRWKSHVHTTTVTYILGRMWLWLWCGLLLRMTPVPWSLCLSGSQASPQIHVRINRSWTFNAFIPFYFPNTHVI